MKNINASDFISIISNEKMQFIVFDNDDETQKNQKTIKILNSFKDLDNMYYFNSNENKKNKELSNYLEINGIVIFGFKNGNWIKYKAKDFNEVALKKFLGVKKIKG